MLNAVIRFSLQNRVLVIALAVFLLGYGSWQAARLPIDVFPDLNRPRVVVMTEAPGMAPEEVETLITFPLETALNGASGVQVVRSTSGVGLSVIYVEFDWGTNIYNDRQIVNERLALVAEQLPPGIRPQLAPISSIMGQIQIIGMVSDPEQTSPMELRTLADWVVRQRLLTIPGVSQVMVMGGERKQFQVLVNPHELLRYGVTLHEVKTALEESNQNTTGGYLKQQGPDEFLVRSLGRVRSVEDIEQIVVAHRGMQSIRLSQVARVIEGRQVKRGDSAAYVRTADEQGFEGGPAVVLTITRQPGADTRYVTDEVLAAIQSLRPSLPDDVQIFPELYQQRTFIDLAVENVAEALRDGGILVVVILFLFLMNLRTTFITLTAIPLSIVMTAVVFATFGLSINTMTLGGLAVAIGELVDDAIVDVENIFRRLRENRHRGNPKHPLLVVFQASCEIRNSIVYGTLIVVLVFVPLFALSGMEGQLFRPLGVAYIVSILSSLLVSLTVTPVLSYWLLSEGRRAVGKGKAAEEEPLRPAAPEPAASDSAESETAASEPAGSRGAAHQRPHGARPHGERQSPPEERDGPLLRFLKWLAGGVMRFGMRFPLIVLWLATVAAAGALLMVYQPPGTAPLLEQIGYPTLDRDFLPPFNEGAVQINLLLPPGTSLATSESVVLQAEKRLMELPDIVALVRKTGRAELDEHAEGVNVNEIIATIDPNSERSREEIIQQISHALEDVPGAVTSVEQPLAHLISHMLSGVKAQVAIKLYGDDFNVLRRTAQQIKSAIETVPGIRDLQVDQQTLIPQLRIEADPARLATFGLRRLAVNEYVATAMQGEVVSQVLDGQRTFDLLVRLDEPFREDREALRRLTLNLPDGGTAKLEDVARIYDAGGPNVIQRERVRRMIVVQCNVTEDRGLVDVVDDIKARLQSIEAQLPAGYHIEYGGQFESQQSASTMISLLFLISLGGMALVLYKMFGSANLSLQVMSALPMALIGSVAALWVTGQTLSVAAMVGFVSLAGIASRNGILLINHYLHLVRFEGESWTRDMIIRAGQERLAPVLMTALTSGIGLVPLALAAGEPGKEILYPVATVIIGGLITSTLLEFLVRPALFWKFGIGSAQRVIEAEQETIELFEEGEVVTRRQSTS